MFLHSSPRAPWLAVSGVSCLHPPEWRERVLGTLFPLATGHHLDPLVMHLIAEMEKLNLGESGEVARCLLWFTQF